MGPFSSNKMVGFGSSVNVKVDDCFVDITSKAILIIILIQQNHCQTQSFRVSLTLQLKFLS